MYLVQNYIMIYVIYLCIIIHSNVHDYITYIHNNNITWIRAELLHSHIKTIVAKGDGLASAKQKAAVQNKIKHSLNQIF